jgi:hypothetical protein
VGVTTRCPKCGKNNYGAVKKCSFCGSPLVFIPGEEIPQISEDDVQAKLSALKVERIRNPVLIGGGGIVSVIGLFFAIILFLIFMVWIFSPTHVSPYATGGSIHYEIPGGEEYLFGEITYRTMDGEEAEISGYGHWAGFYAYEINGDGVDKRERADQDQNVALEPDTWVYSKKKIGDVGDKVLIKVKSDLNYPGQIRPVTDGKAAWGGSGWISGGWIFLLPGFLLLFAGIAILAVGLIGKADRSMERLMEEDKEFRRQQLMLREAARKQMAVQQQQQQWASYSGEAPPAQTPIGPEGQVQPQSVPQGMPQQASFQEPVEQTQPVQQGMVQQPAYQAPTGSPQQAVPQAGIQAPAQGQAPIAPPPQGPSPVQLPQQPQQ